MRRERRIHRLFRSWGIRPQAARSSYLDGPDSLKEIRLGRQSLAQRPEPNFPGSNSHRPASLVAARLSGGQGDNHETASHFTCSHPANARRERLRIVLVHLLAERGRDLLDRHDTVHPDDRDDNDRDDGGQAGAQPEAAPPREAGKAKGGRDRGAGHAHRYAAAPTDHDDACRPAAADHDASRHHDARRATSATATATATHRRPPITRRPRMPARLRAPAASRRVEAATTTPTTTAAPATATAACELQER